MSARVTLRVVGGPLRGREFRFAERTTCLVGRAADCNIQLPSDEAHRLVSRHHCLVDVNPPDVRVRDFGSRNGTYVNGNRIGGGEGEDPGHELREGDSITIGKTTFRLVVERPAACALCGTEIPVDGLDVAKQGPGVYECADCRERAVEPPPGAATKPVVCVQCGRDVSGEAGADRPGEFVCSACKREPRVLAQGLLDGADAGRNTLRPMRGYEILRELGRGGVGAVYLARHRDSGEQVALKMLLPQVAANETARRRFLREAENTQALHHPNVVRLLDAGCVRGVFFLVLEYCDAGSVVDLMRQRGGCLGVKEAVGLTLQALAGLEYAHGAAVPHAPKPDGTRGAGHGLVHRDVKPANLFLTNGPSGLVAKVGDFGLAKAFDSVGLSGCTRTGAVSGTPLFMPRGQLVNFKYAGPEVDVWSAAATLYYLLTSCAPRNFPSGRDWCRVLLDDRPVPIRERDPFVPPRLAEVIDRALVDNPEIQVKSAAELRALLKQAMA